MATYLSNRDSDGKTNEEGHYRFQSRFFQGNVLSGFITSQSLSPGMSVSVSAGDIRIPYTSYAYLAWSDAPITLTVPTSDVASPRVDSVVAYIDRSMTFAEGDTNNPGALKLKVVQGVPSALPVKPTSASIQTSVGISNPWAELATINVGASSTQVLDSSIQDIRTIVTLPDNSVKSSTILDKSVTTSKMKPTYKIFSGNSGSTRQSGVGAGTLIVDGSSFVYTTGSTAELLVISSRTLVQCTGGGSQYMICVNGTRVGNTDYSDLQNNNMYITRYSTCLYEAPSNTTVTIDSRVIVFSGNITVANTSNDQTSGYGHRTEMFVFSR